MMGGETWGSEIVVVAESGDIDNELAGLLQMPNGDIHAYYHSDVNTGVSYAKNELFRTISTDGGTTWGSAVKLIDSYWHAEGHPYFDSEGNVRMASMRRYQQGASFANDLFVTVQKIGGSLLGDFGWQQDSGILLPVLDDADPTMRIVGNPPDAVRAFAQNTNTTPDDFVLEGRLRPFNDAQVRLTFRYTDTNNHYLLLLDATNTILFERVSGTYNQLDTVAGGIADLTWADFKVEANGTALKTYIGGNLRNDITDSRYSGGAVALATGSDSDNAVEFQDVRLRKWDGEDPAQTVGSEAAVS